MVSFQCLTNLHYILKFYVVFSLHIPKKQNKINIHFAQKKKIGHYHFG